MGAATQSGIDGTGSRATGGGPFVMGVDLGSNTAKTVILDIHGVLCSQSVVKMGSVSRRGVRASIAEALEGAGLTQANIARTISTGYGRRMVDVADKTFTEITCHARGAAVLAPGVRMVIDIGGQDSKVIAIDENGFVEHFAMNDRCAGGTGKFFEVLAEAIDVEIEEIGPLALNGGHDLTISSMCATFAETEVISMLAEDRSREDILAAVHTAVAKRTIGLVSRVGIRTPVVMTGGVAKNPAAVKFLEQALNIKLVLPQNPQIAGAYGAALLALDDLRAELNHIASVDEENLADREIPRSTDPACSRLEPGEMANPGQIGGIPVRRV